ncbi:MAG: hypothetical protein ACI957_001677, partial [Verrucomicrobiales bacterium]
YVFSLFSRDENRRRVIVPVEQDLRPQVPLRYPVHTVWSGTEQDWEEKKVVLGPGLHTIRWTYEKDSIGIGGSDSGWISDVSLEGYAQWAAPHLAMANLAVDEDPDGDGLTNFMEFALGGSPTQSDSSPLPVREIDAEGKLCVDLLMQEGFHYQIDFSDDGQFWNSLATDTIENAEMMTLRSRAVWMDDENIMRFMLVTIR